MEAIPILVGFALGAMWPRGRWIGLVAAGIVVGVAVAAISGELAESVWFAVFDSVTGIVGAVLGVAAREVMARRQARHSES